ncbi:MAG: DUF6531 domain-containing protein [Pseudomonadota bacterium]
MKTLFPNEQSPAYGLQTNYVNSRKGNLTFLVRDLVIADNIPIVFGRVYDSRDARRGDFGNGWKLSVSEYLVSKGDEWVYVDASGSVWKLKRSRNRLVPEFHLDGHLEGGRVDRNTVVIRTDGLVKRFVRKGKRFVLTRVRDRSGNDLRLAYENGRVSRITTQSGQYVDVMRDDTGRIVGATDSYGRRVSYEYGSSGSLERTIDRAGSTWTYEYTSGGQLAAIRTTRSGALHDVLRAEFDSKGRATAVEYLGTATSFEYRGSTTRITDIAGRTAAFDHADSGFVEAIVDWTGKRTAVTFDERNRVTGLYSDDALVAEIDYVNDRLVRIVQSTSEGRVSSELRYGAAGMLKSASVENDGEYGFGYNDRGQIVRSATPDTTFEYEYTDDGNISAATIDGVRTEMEYTSRGGLKTIETDEHAISLGYEAGTSSPSSIDVSLKETEQSFSYEYDHTARGFRELAIYRSKEGQERSPALTLGIDYDELGNMLRLNYVGPSDSHMVHAYEIGASNELTGVQTSSGLDSEYEYDVFGKPTYARMGEQSARFGYDEYGRIQTVEKDGEVVLDHAYGPNDVGLARLADQRTNEVVTEAPVFSSVFGHSTAVIYSRPSGSPYGYVRFDAQLARFIIDRVPFALPDSVERSSLARRQITEIDGMPFSLPFNGFDKASSSLFIPPEYYRVNCGVCAQSVVGGNLGLQPGTSLALGEFTGFRITMSYGSSCAVNIPIPGGYPSTVTIPTPYLFDIDTGDGNTMQTSVMGGVFVPPPPTDFTHTYAETGSFAVSSVVQCTCEGFWTLAILTTSVSVSDPKSLVTKMGNLINRITQTGVILNRINTTVTVANIVSGTAGNTVKWAIKDIETYRQTGGLHVPSAQGSVIPWQTVQVDWDEYGASDSSLTPAQVLENLYDDAQDLP